MTIPMERITVKNEHLPKVREVIKSSTDREVRRFIVDGHNGKEYWHNEINVAEKPELGQMQNVELVKYIKETCLKEGYQIYAIVEVKGNYTIEQLDTMPHNVIADIMRPVYYDFFDEPLESFHNTL